MKLQPPYFLPDELVRLMVLCCLTYLGPCTDQQLLEWVSEYDVMNYFDLMIALSELCKQGQAECRQKRRKSWYQITDAGRKTLELFENRVPASVRSRLKETADAWRMRFSRDNQIRTEVKETDQNEYEVTLAVVEQDRETMTLQVVVPTKEIAWRMVRQWREHVQEVYSMVFRVLAEDEK